MHNNKCIVVPLYMWKSTRISPHYLGHILYVPKVERGGKDGGKISTGLKKGKELGGASNRLFVN